MVHRLNAGQHRKPWKFLAASDDINIAGYLYREVDQNICLYQTYHIPTTHMNDTALGKVNLLPSCKTDSAICGDTLRFTDVNDEAKIFDPDADGYPGIDYEVTCK